MLSVHFCMHYGKCFSHSRTGCSTVNSSCGVIHQWLEFHEQNSDLKALHNLFKLAHALLDFSTFLLKKPPVTCRELISMKSVMSCRTLLLSRIVAHQRFVLLNVPFLVLYQCAASNQCSFSLSLSLSVCHSFCFGSDCPCVLFLCFLHVCVCVLSPPPVSVRPPSISGQPNSAPTTPTAAHAALFPASLTVHSFVSLHQYCCPSTDQSLQQEDR